MATYAAFQANKLALGREVTPGNAVAATTIWRGAFAMPDDARNRVIVDEQVGLLVSAERSFDASLLARLAMPATELTFEQLPHILEAGVGTDAAPVNNTGSYTYQYAFPTGSTPNTIKTYTIEAYNAMSNADMQEIPYCFVEEFELSGKYGEAWTMGATWVGRQLLNTTPTNLSTLVSVTEAPFARTKLYIDAAGGAVGSTQKTGVLTAADMTVTTGIIIVPVGDGNLYFATHKFTKPEITFSLTVEVESGGLVDQLRTSYKDNDTLLYRWAIDGPDANHSVVIDFAGNLDAVGNYENSDGNTTVTLEGHVVYSATDALFWECEVTNTLASLP